NDFSAIQILDLHGSGTRRDRAVEAEKDQNVFDILQGVCVLTLGRPSKHDGAIAIYRGDLWGSREAKYKILSNGSPARLVRTSVKPHSPQWFFISRDLTNEAEWHESLGLLEAFPINGNGLISAKDHFAYAFTRTEFLRDLDVFLNPKLTDEQVAEQLS